MSKLSYTSYGPFELMDVIFSPVCNALSALAWGFARGSIQLAFRALDFLANPPGFWVALLSHLSIVIHTIMKLWSCVLIASICITVHKNESPLLPQVFLSVISWLVAIRGTVREFVITCMPILHLWKCNPVIQLVFCLGLLDRLSSFFHRSYACLLAGAVYLSLLLSFNSMFSGGGRKWDSTIRCYLGSFGFTTHFCMVFAWEEFTWCWCWPWVQERGGEISHSSCCRGWQDQVSFLECLPIATPSLQNSHLCIRHSLCVYDIHTLLPQSIPFHPFH